MELNKLYKIKFMLKELQLLLHKKNSKFYLTNEEKLKLLKEDKRVPLRVKGNGRNVKLLVKVRDPIESGELKNKRMGL